MTPQERQRVSDLFDRLATLENAPRDPDAERAIAEGLRRAPSAVYPLVQTVLLQDEALRRADARLRDLEATGEQSGGFLDSMRDALFGGRANAPPSVPTVRQNLNEDSRWREPTPGAAAQSAAPLRGGSFLGTAAASAVGVVGGMMMANMIGSLLGHSSSSGQAFAASPSTSSPWDQQAANSDLARDAGLGDIGGEQRHASLFGGDDGYDSSAGADDFGDDFGGDVGGDL